MGEFRMPNGESNEKQYLIAVFSKSVRGQSKTDSGNP